MRKASSRNLSSGSPIALTTWSFRSLMPLWRSMMMPSEVLAAKALIVKSRLSRSLSSERTKVTLSGWRPSE